MALEDAKNQVDEAFTNPDLKGLSYENTFGGAPSFLRRRYTKDLAGVDLAVTGIPFDQAVTNRPGTRFGPRAIRAASTNLGWARAWPSSIDPFEAMAVADWGDIRLDLAHPAGVPNQIQAAISAVLAETQGVLLLGGDHFTTYPSLKAHAGKHGAPISLIQFDAHTDTWEGDEGDIDHGTMFYHAAREGIIDPATSVQVGIRTTNDETMGFNIRDAIWCHQRSPDEIAAEIRRIVGDRPAYVTFDIDGLDPSCAPGTGTPVVGGLFTWQALAILRALKGINLIGMDVVEVSPPYDHAEITALAGATIALELLCLYASRPK